MLYVYIGTDRERARAAMRKEIEKSGSVVLRITDANAVEDLRAALEGPGMFSEKRILVFEGVCVNPELCDILLDALGELAQSDEKVVVYEEKLPAEMRKKFEKHAKAVETFAAPKREKDGEIFALARALERGDKKQLWVGYVRELSKGTAPEAIHGVLFWAAKQHYLKSGDTTHSGAGLVSALAELPHEARRKGIDIEYALERFVLGA